MTLPVSRETSSIRDRFYAFFIFTIIITVFVVVVVAVVIISAIFRPFFRRYEWLTLSVKVWTHVTASRWPKCCANSRASARDCPQPPASPTRAAESTAAGPSSTRTATTRSGCRTSTWNACRRTATRKRPYKH